MKVITFYTQKVKSKTYIVLSHFRADPVTGALNALDGVLDLVGSRDVFPGVKEGLLLHRS